MKMMDNGALLALGVVGLAAAAGRVKRGSFASSPLKKKIAWVFSLSEEDEEVDSSALSDALYDASESDEVPVALRHEADELLARAEFEEYLDSGEGLELLGRIRDSLGKGSRAVGVNAHSAKSRAEYIAYLVDLEERAKAGKLTLDEDARWSHGAETSSYAHHNVNRKERTKAILKNIATERDWISTWPKRNPGAGSRAIYGMSSHDAGHVLRLGHGKPRKMAGEALNDYRWHPDRALAQFSATKAKKRGDRNVEEQEDSYDPEADAAISDARGGGVALSIEGRHIGTYKDDPPAREARSFEQAKGRKASLDAMDKALKAFRDWCDKHSYYPSLYWISDHGNVHGPISPKTGKAYKRRGGRNEGSRAKAAQGKVGGGYMFKLPLTPGGPPRLGPVPRSDERRGPPRLNPYTGQFKSGQIIKGGSRAYGMLNEMSVIDPKGGRKKLLRRREGESADEFLGRAWLDVEEWLTGARLGHPAKGTEVLVWFNHGHRLNAHPSDDVTRERYVSTGKPYTDRWERIGFDGRF